MVGPGGDLVTLLGGLGGPPARPGTVHLVGGGPGDPGLLTLRAAVLLSTCDVVLYDRLSPPEVLDLVPDQAERLMVGKRYAETGMPRAEVDALMASRAVQGKAVVRLKGGDPFVFGRGSEEAESLHLAGIPFEVVSGVTSAVAVPAAAGIPVTHRGLSAGFAVVTGHEDPDKRTGHVDYTTLGRFPGTLVLLMGVNHLAEITDQLIAHGRDPDEPAAIVQWGTTPRQASLRATVATIADAVAVAGIRSPAITVIGAVAGLSEVLAWREQRPLHGLRVLVPRSREQASMLSMRIRSLGGEAVEAPTIEIRPGDRSAMDVAVEDLASGAYAAIALTSPNGVDALADAIDRVGLDGRALAGAGLVACVGPGTAARLWERLRVHADLVPPVSTTAALGQAWPEAPSHEFADRAVEVEVEGAGPAVLLPRADLATDQLVHALRHKGWDAVRVDAYVTAAPDDFPAGVADALAEGSIDLIAFASSSTVRNFVALLDGRDWHGRIVSIGPVTSATCMELGLPVAVEADPHTLDGLADALVAAAALRDAT